MNYLETEFNTVKQSVFHKTDIELSTDNFITIMVKYFKAKIITVNELKNLPLDYPESFSSIEEFSENFITSSDEYLIFLTDMRSDNDFLEENERRYNLLIIKSTNNKIKNYYCNYHEGRETVQYIIEKFIKQ